MTSNYPTSSFYDVPSRKGINFNCEQQTKFPAVRLWVYRAVSHLNKIVKYHDFLSEPEKVILV